MSTIVLRGYQSDKDPWEFVASTETIDRYGDVISADGWDLRNFKKNPIALWQHSGNTPIGVWENVRVESGKLIAKLQMAKAGTSSVIDMLRGLIEQRILRAVSVGFIPKKAEPLNPDDPRSGLRYTKSELLEISVVSVPANPDALAVVKSMGMSEDLVRQVFSSGPPAPKPGNRTMTLAERIKAREAEILRKKDLLADLAGKDDSSFDDEQRSQHETEVSELTLQIETETKSLDTLKRAQASLAASSQPAEETRKPELGAPPQVRSVGKKDPAMLLVRAAIVHTRSYIERRDVDEIIRKDYGGSREVETLVRAVANPAMTSVQGWAAELVGETIGGFVDILRPQSIFFNIPMLSLTFGNGKIKLPNRASGTLAGDFVAEGAPIPVKQLALASTSLEPNKLGVITTFTREIAKMSNPAIEPLLRDIMVADTRDTIDTLFLDNTAAVAGLRPAGLQNLAGANSAASTGTTLANIVTDLRAAIAAMTNANFGRNLVWIMNRQRALSLSLITNAAGSFMFRDEIAQGTLLGIPLLTSTTVPSAVVFLMDAAEFANALESAPEIDVSEQATLHMQSTPATVPATAGTVAPIVGVGTGAGNATAVGDIANPVRSLFQTATIALRLIWDLTWAQRRPGAVYAITGVAW